MNFLRLRRTPKLAVPKHDTDIFFVDVDGVFKKMGPDGTVAEVGGGGGGGSTLVTESGYYSGGQVAAGNRPPWSILDAGTDVLDRTSTTQPLAREDGLYIISAEVFVQAAHLAPECDLIFDYTDVAATMRGFAVDNVSGFSALVSGSYVLATGQAIRLTVSTDEFATTVELRNALVSRIGPA